MGNLSKVICVYDPFVIASESNTIVKMGFSLIIFFFLFHSLVKRGFFSMLLSSLLTHCYVESFNLKEFKNDCTLTVSSYSTVLATSYCTQITCSIIHALCLVYTLVVRFSHIKFSIVRIKRKIQEDFLCWLVKVNSKKSFLYRKETVVIAKS